MSSISAGPARARETSQVSSSSTQPQESMKHETAVPVLNVDTSATRKRAAPIPIPPKSPRRAHSQSGSRASSSIPPVPSPSGLSSASSSISRSPAPGDPFLYATSDMQRAGSPSSAFLGYTSEEGSAPPTPPAKSYSNPAEAAPEASTSASPRKHRAQRTSMVPMNAKSGTSRRSRPSTATSATEVPLQRTQSGPSPSHTTQQAADSNDMATTDEDTTLTFGESSIPISLRRRSTARSLQPIRTTSPKMSPTAETTNLPRNRHSPIASPSRSPTTHAGGAWMYAASPSRSRPSTAGSPGTTSKNTSPRTRTSQATSAYPFEYDASGSESEEAKLERDFMAAIERRRRSNSPELRFSKRASVPWTAHSTDTFALDSRTSVASAADATAHAPATAVFQQRRQEVGPSPTEATSRSLPEDSNVVLRGSRYQSGHPKTDWAIPISKASPVGSVGDGGKSLVEDFQTRWHLSSADRDRRGEDSDSAGLSSTDFMRRDSADSAGMRSRRMGRVFSIDSDSGRSDLITPRGSVSNQSGGPATSSMYSTTGTLLESYPHAGGQPLSAMPEETEADSLGKDRPMSQESKTSALSNGSSAVEFGTPMSELPTSFIMTGNGFPTEGHFQPPPVTPGAETSTSYDGSIPPTPASETYKGSMSSLSLTTDSESVDASVTGTEASESDKLAQKRDRTIDELISTEESFLQDMLLTRDVWLARARGTELAEIMATLRSDFWLQSMVKSTTEQARRRSSARTTRVGSIAPQPSSRRPTPEHSRLSSDVLPSAAMARGGSQTSSRSMRGFTNPFGSDRSGPHARLSQSAGPTSGQDVRKEESLAKSLRLGSTKLRASISSAVSIPDRGQVVNHGSSLLAPMTAVDIKAIFSNLVEVIEFAQAFLADLEACRYGDEDEGAAHGNYGRTFLDNLNQLEKVYSVYCSKFDAAIARYDSLSGNLPQYNSECKELSQGLTNAWDLPSLLIKPVQRCLKYPLFIQSLLGCTLVGHPDREALEQASARILKVAEDINELKRRQELVGRIVKPRVRSDSYSGLRRGSSGVVKPRSSSSEMATSKSSRSLTSRFKRSSSAKMQTDPPPANDPVFDALLAKLDSKHKAIYTFLPEAKAWAKAVRAMLLTLLQLSLVWKGVAMALPGEEQNDGRSSRTIDYFASAVVKPIIEGPWHDLDQEIRGPLTDKVSQLLDLFRNPRAVIAKRHQKLADCQMPTSVKQEKLAKDSAVAYHALNGQLLDELPVFMRALETFFSGIIARFVALQTALQRVIADSWLDYAHKTCNQLGELDQSSNTTLTHWWRLHKPIVEQLDTLKILASDQLLAKIDKARRQALPPMLRERQVSSTASIVSNRSTASQVDLRHHNSSERLRASSQAGQTPPPPVPRKPPSSGPAPEENRSSTLSASSANSYRSLAYTSRTGSSVTSPETPSLEYLPAMWLGATTAAHSSASSKASQPARPYPYLDCEVGDLFDVLDETQFGKHGLVRKQDGISQIGLLPLHLLVKVQ